MSTVLDKFLRYVKIDTTSAEADTVPSTPGQFDLARLLQQELSDMGAANVRLDEAHCYVYATLPATSKKQLPALGFIAHMDTSAAVSGKDVKPQIVKNYDGGDIALGDSGLVLRPADYPELLDCVGQDLITTDGTTLLGADDKAGVAEIMQMAQTLLADPSIEHGTIQIAFTPDEEVGSGVAFFDVEGFGADFAYTVDGGRLGEISYENFNAASALVHINGTSIHPGSARGKMVNALLVAMELQDMLPRFEDPAATDLYEGFYHLNTMQGNCDAADMLFIIRDHDRDTFERRKVLFQKAVDFLNEKYKPGTVELTLKDSYHNMAEIIRQNQHLVDNAVAVMQELGITPLVEPIRGGTDGAQLSYMGLPCPNLCTGGANFHGRLEYAVVQSMEQVVALLLGIVARYAQ